MQDPAYRDFQSNLMPGIDKDTIIGIRTPQLRRFAKQLAQTAEAEQFLHRLPHQYYEENNLHKKACICYKVSKGKLCTLAIWFHL